MKPSNHHPHSIQRRLSEGIEEIEEQVRASGAYMEDLLQPAQAIVCDLAEEALQAAEMALAMGDAGQIRKHLEDVRAYIHLARQFQFLQEAEDASLLPSAPPERVEIEASAI